MIDPHARLVLDTSVVLLPCRGQGAAGRLEERSAIRLRTPRPTISVVSVGEMLAFSRSLRWGDRKRDALRDTLADLVVTCIDAPRVLDAYADLSTALQAAGRAMGQQNDLWIAATAHALGATVLTADRDFLPLAPYGVARESVDPRTLVSPP